MSFTRRLRRCEWLATSLAPFALFALLAGCGATQTVSSGGTALVVIGGAAEDARVRVDGMDRGTVARTNGTYLVEAGSRRLEVITSGYLPFWVDLTLRAGESYDVQVPRWPCFSGLDQGCWTHTESVLDQLPSGGL